MKLILYHYLNLTQPWQRQRTYITIKNVVVSSGVCLAIIHQRQSSPCKGLVILLSKILEDKCYATTQSVVSYSHISIRLKLHLHFQLLWYLWDVSLVTLCFCTVKPDTHRGTLPKCYFAQLQKTCLSFCVCNALPSSRRWRECKPAINGALPVFRNPMVSFGWGC